jgi:hypothetical protein
MSRGAFEMKTVDCNELYNLCHVPVFCTESHFEKIQLSLRFTQERNCTGSTRMEIEIVRQLLV